jgi:3-oxoadipate enol-lactonase
VDLACLVTGPQDAPPLVLLHALGERASDWDVVAASLSAHRRVFAVDLRGHGDSEWPGDYSLELMRDDVLALLDSIGLDAVDLIGHSMGGVVAYLVAAAQPRRIRSLVLEDVPVPRPRPVIAPERPAGELEFDWEMVLAVRRQLDDPDPAWLGDLARITAPTLVIWGGPQSPMSAERVGELAQRIDGAQLITIDAGHLVHATRPAEFVAAVAEFLDHSAP